MRTSLTCTFAVLGIAGATYAQPIRIATGSNNTVDGYLNIAPDEYGAWAQPFAGGAGPNDDNFNPTGTLPIRSVAFSSGFFIFVGSTERELLSDSADWQNTNSTLSGPFNSDVSLDRAVTAANVASDATGDGVNDTLTSAFRVFNASGTTNLSFTLTQEVRSISAGVSIMRQSYSILNSAPNPIDFSLVRGFDGDLIFTGTNYANDEVGTTCNAGTIGQFVYMREPANNATGVTLHGGADGRYYYGGKQNHTPTNGPPAMGFGTDVQVWDAYGVPASWQNYIATVGYDTDGFNGAVTGTQDSFIGLDFGVSLPANGTRTIVVTTTYGQITPAAIPCPGDLNGDLSVGLSDLTLLLANFGTTGSGIIGDIDNDGDVDLSDLTAFLANFGTSC